MLESILPFSHRFHSGIAMIGDFNIDPVSNSLHLSVQCLNDASNTLNLQQMVNFITHPNSSSETNGSVIDLLFTSSPDMFTNICVQPC